MKKVILFICILAVVAGFFGYFKYNQPHTETAGSVADYVITPSDLLQAYEADEDAANKKYLDKIIQVEGVVKAYNFVDSGGSLTLETGSEMSAIICEFESGNNISKIKIGETVKIKGICTGKLMDIVLVRCSL